MSSTAQPGLYPSRWEAPKITSELAELEQADAIVAEQETKRKQAADKAAAQAQRIRLLLAGIPQQTPKKTLIHPLMSTVTVAPPTKAINIFEYERLVALAEAEVADAQLKVFEKMMQLDYQNKYAESVAKSEEDVRVAGDMTTEEAAQVNELLAVVRKAKQTLYQIKQGTRLT